jgi:hypothetical protein
MPDMPHQPDASLAPADVEELEELRRSGTRFKTRCLECGQPIEHAETVFVSAQIHAGTTILAVGFQSPTAGWTADPPGAPVPGQRRSFTCRGGRHRRNIKTETWFRWMVEAKRRGRDSVTVPEPY